MGLYLKKHGMKEVTSVNSLRLMELTLGSILYLKYHTTAGDGGHGVFRAVTGAAVGTYIDNNGTIIVPTGGDGSAAWVREYSVRVHAKWFGIVGDGIQDETTKIASLLSWLPSHSILDLGGGVIELFNNVVGTTGTTDSIALNAIPRLLNKTNIVIENGTLRAHAHSVSTSKLNYPSTFSIDRCNNVTFNNVELLSKGESFGNTDNSIGLSFALRKLYAMQNGGHAVIVAQSENIKFNNCRFIYAGSVASFYSMSSNKVFLEDCYSSPVSLGYAAYAFDSWAGGIATTLFKQHYASLINCNTDNYGGAYGSKGGVVVEDNDVYVNVTGGSYKDCYANGAAHHIGSAFIASNATLVVDGSLVDNCAAIGTTMESVATVTKVNVSNVIATNLRTSMHIQGNFSFGTSEIKYSNCDASITGVSLWSEPELSVSTVIANMSASTTRMVTVENCNTNGADTFSINSVANYGGIKVIGGTHRLINHIFDSAGWGGSTSNSGSGFEVLSGAKFILSSASITASKVTAAASITAITNFSGGVYTHQLVHFDKSCKIISSGSFANAFSIATSGTGLSDLNVIECDLSNCYSAYTTKRQADVRVVSLDGIAGSNVKVTFAFPDNYNETRINLIDDAGAVRHSPAGISGLFVAGNEIHSQVYMNSGAYNLTVGSTYKII